jgi:hypothetical protein
LDGDGVAKLQNPYKRLSTMVVIVGKEEIRN